MAKHSVFSSFEDFLAGIPHKQQCLKQLAAIKICLFIYMQRHHVHVLENIFMAKADTDHSVGFWLTVSVPCTQ